MKQPGSPASPERRLLCEGWIEPGCEGGGDIMVPSVAYVVQRDRVWFAKGDATRVDESVLLVESTATVGGATNRVMTRRMVVESFDDLELEERQTEQGVVKVPKDGRWFVEGPFQRSDTPNANKRRYPRGIWEKLIGDDKSYVQQTIRERGMLGHLEHPQDGRTDGKEGAVVITGAKLLDDGVVWGQAEILDTPNGQILQEYTRKGVRWGVSSRGNGSVKGDGTVEEGSYVLETWDAVMKPSVQGAYPSVPGKKETQFAEGEQRPLSEDEGDVLIVLNPQQFLRRARGVTGFLSDAAFARVQGFLERVVSDAYSKGKPLNSAIRKAAFGYLKQDRKLADLLLKDGWELQEHAEGAAPAVVEEFEADVQRLSETALDEAGPEDRARFQQDVIAALTRSNDFASQGALSHDKAIELQGWLMRKLAESVTPATGIDERIDRAFRQLDSDDEQEGAFEHVIESLKQRLSDVIAELGSVRKEREVAESRAVVLQEQFDVACEQLSEVGAELGQTQRKLTLAEDLLVSRKGAVPNGTVVAAVEEAIRAVPQLGSFRDLLTESADPAEVRLRAERLLPRAVASRASVPEPPRSDRHARASLPPVGGLVESDDAGAMKPALSSRPSSQGAKTAAAVVKLNETRTKQ